MAEYLQRRSSIVALARLFGCSLVTPVMPAYAQSSDTTTYAYDARGRLIEVRDSSSTASSTTTYSHDAADNRQRVVAAVGGPGGGGGQCTISGEGASPVAGFVDSAFFARVSRSGDCTGTVVVNYVTRDGSAIANQDYPPLSGSLTFNEASTQGIRVYGYAGAAGKDYAIDLSVSVGNATVSTPSLGISIDFP